jgi:hypothetical protein
MTQQRPVKPGVSSAGQVITDIATPRVINIKEVVSLRQGQSRYAWIMPFPVYIQFPDLEVPVVTEPGLRFGVPTDHVCVVFDKEIFDFSHVKTDVRLPGNVLFGVPANELRTLSNCWRAVTLFDGKYNWVMRTQRITMVDPTIPTSRVIDDPSKLTFDLYALVLFRQDHFAYFVPKGNKPLITRVKLVYTTTPPWQTVPADSLPELRAMLTAAAFIEGHTDPFAKQEEILGHDGSFGPNVAGGDEDSTDNAVWRNRKYDDVSDGLPAAGNHVDEQDG